MQSIVDFLHTFLGFLRDPGPVIEWGGLPIIALVIFLETGALVFMLPGDSLLVVAGLYANSGTLSMLGLMTVLPVCAVVGDATSYSIGKRVGPAIFSRPKSRFFDPKHILAARDFYERHGGKAIIIARFMPLVRTFVPVVAGVAGMPYRRFALFNVIGGISWIWSMCLIGYAFGEIPGVRQHLEKIIILVVFISILPGIISWWQNRGKKKAEPTPAA